MMISCQVPFIKHWKIIEGEYTSAPDLEATWFIDPPYHRSGNLYLHQVNSYTDLSDWCRSRQGQVMVCEQGGATWLPFTPFRSTKVFFNESSMEVLWTRKD
jgi:hypothetical protein